MKATVLSQVETTRLAGRRLFVARALWLGLTISYLIMLVASAPEYWKKLLLDPYGLARPLAQIGLTVDIFVLYVIVLNYSTILVLMSMAIFIFWRKSDDWMAIMVSLMLVAICGVILPITGGLADSDTLTAALYHALRALGFGIVLAVLFLFPDGHFTPDWTRYILLLWFGYGISWLIFPQLAPLAAPADIRSGEHLVSLASSLVWLAAGIFSQIFRYKRVSDPVRRQQIKWVVFGFTMFMAGMFAISLPVLFLPVVRQPGTKLLSYLLVMIPVVLFCLTLVPLTIMFSILKYKLWVIDAIFRRTLAYTALTATLVVLYSLSVMLLQMLFTRLIGRGENLAIVGSTLAMAAIFNPLRARIQGDIDRRFYRQKYDAERLVVSFGASLRDEVEMNQLVLRLLQATQETLQPDGAELWLVHEHKGRSSMQVTRSSIFKGGSDV